MEIYMAKIGVLGAGSWGTAISVLLSNNDHEVTEEVSVWQLGIPKEAVVRQIIMISDKGFSVGYGMGSNSAILAHVPELVKLVFGGSGIVPAAMAAILLNILLPKEKKEAKA